MARYATLQYKQHIKLPLKPFARTRRHQRYRLASPAWERACEVQMYQDEGWLRENLPCIQTLIQAAPQLTVGAFPLDIVLDERGEATGLLLPAVEGQALLNYWETCSSQERSALAYQLFVLAGRLEEQPLPIPITIDLSQFIVAKDGKIDWQWNEEVLSLLTNQPKPYMAWWEQLLPHLAFSQPHQPKTAWEAAAQLLLVLPKPEAQYLLSASLDTAFDIAEQRLPIPTLAASDKSFLTTIDYLTKAQWPELSPQRQELPPHPYAATLETVVWMSMTGCCLIGLNYWIIYWAWPAVQEAYAQSWYALIAAWLVGGLALVGLCLIGGSYAALKLGSWMSVLCQKMGASYFYKTHPHLLRLEDATSLEQYHYQQEALQEQLADLQQEGKRWLKASQQCQNMMIKIRTEANRQLEQAYEYCQAAYWQQEQQRQRQGLEALEGEQVAGLARQLREGQQLLAQESIIQEYQKQVTQIKHRYWVVQSEQQQDWQHYKKEAWLLQQRLADWNILRQAHEEKREEMEAAARAWSLEAYQQYYKKQ